MKKAIAVFLAVMIIIGLINICFAASELEPEEVPLGVPQTVNNAQYGEDITIYEGVTPQSGSITESGSVIDIKEEEIPKAMPKTGGVPAEVFYIAGVLLIGVAIVLTFSRKKSKA